MQFTAYGHENILAAHKTTIEFTKDAELSKKGDCIVAVNSDFSLKDIKNVLNADLIKIIIKIDHIKEEIIAKPNKHFSSDKEIVIRTSDFISERTLAVNANKASKDLNRDLIKRLTNPEQKATIIIKPIKIKAVIFDFDDTLERFKIAKHYAERKIGQYFYKKYKIKNIAKELDNIDLKYVLKGFKVKNPKFYDRTLWFSDLFKKHNIVPDKNEIKYLISLYWKHIEDKITPMSHAKNLLKKLKKHNIKTIILTDSDGSKKIKLRRVEKLNLKPDLVLTGDDLNTTKPDKRFYDYIFKRFNLKPENCIMVGDKPEFDLEQAKELGITTVWLKYGDWAESEAKKHFRYVDYSISKLKHIIELLF